MVHLKAKIIKITRWIKKRWVVHPSPSLISQKIRFFSQHFSMQNRSIPSLSKHVKCSFSHWRHLRISRILWEKKLFSTLLNPKKFTFTYVKRRAIYINMYILMFICVVSFLTLIIWGKILTYWYYEFAFSNAVSNRDICLLVLLW